ncbi:MAG: heme ABC transporter ATP-binding protein [Deinococcota bacterium]
MPEASPYTAQAPQTEAGITLEAQDLGYRRGKRWLVRGVSLRLEGGQFWALLGPNGAGKTTLLRLLSGEIPPDAGQVTLDRKPLGQYRASELARTRAFLPQQRDLAFPFSAYEVAFLGRMPYLEDRAETAADHQVVQQALERTDALALAEELYPSLSGGEKARVDLARVLAQEPKILLLDEPTNHLDPRHQLELLEHCRELARSGRIVLAALHDLNLASLFADRLLLMKDGQAVASGTAEELFTPELLERVYGLPFQRYPHPSGRPVVLPQAT